MIAFTEPPPSSRAAQRRGDPLFRHTGCHPVKQPAVYIMASGRNGTIYVGVTSDLVQRVYQHQEGVTGGFTARYGCTRLVCFELFADMTAAIMREKQLKAGTRARKIALIGAANPDWSDLYPGIL